MWLIFCFVGKGITDQDRNILTNQMLMLGFLHSVAPFLAAGPIPIIQKPRKKKGSDEEDSGDDDDKNGALDNDASRKARGTVLITLRNVVPYTLWYGSPVLSLLGDSLINCCILQHLSGTYPSSQKRRRGRQLGRHRIQNIFNYDHSFSVGMYG